MDFEVMMELLEGRVVHHNGEPYIKVSDLKELQSEVSEAKAEDQERPKFKGFEAAKKAALEDPEFLAMFEPREPQAPAVGRVKNVSEEEHHAPKVA